MSGANPVSTTVIPAGMREDIFGKGHLGGLSNTFADGSKQAVIKQAHGGWNVYTPAADGLHLRPLDPGEIKKNGKPEKLPIRSADNGKGKPQKTVTPIHNKTKGKVYTKAMAPVRPAQPELSSPASTQTAADDVIDYAKQSGQVLLGYGEGIAMPVVDSVKLAVEGWGNILTQPLETGKALAWGAGEVAGKAVELGGVARGIGSTILNEPGIAWSALKDMTADGVTWVGATLAGDPRQAGKLIGGVVGATVIPIGMKGMKPVLAEAGEASETAKATAKPKASGATILKRKLKTKAMDKHWEGENLKGNKQWKNDGVKYLTPEERASLRLEIRDGKLYDANGNLFDTTDAGSLFKGGDGKAIFVMDDEGNIYASKFQGRGEFHHSSFLGGQPVAGAGEIRVNNGVVDFISDRSGHYQPPPELLGQVIDVFGSSGVDTSRIVLGTW